MHIVINALSIKPRQAGVKTYLINLLEGILDLDNKKKITLLCSYHNKHIFECYDQEWDCVERKVLPLYGDYPTIRIFLDQLLVPWYCIQYPESVLVSVAGVSCFLAPIPEVVIMQMGLSVQPIRQKVPRESVPTSWLQQLYYDISLPVTLWQAEKVVAVSDYLKREIAELYPQFAHKIRTVYEGVDLDSFTTHSRNEGGEVSGSPYLLFVSTLYPYKKADQAIRAFAHVYKKIGNRDLRLKLAGKDPGEETLRLKQIATETGVSDQVDVLGMVPHSEIPALYRGAKVFLFPSTVESFGLPVLEAMACGTPVIASDRTSVPEIVGDAGLIVDPNETKAMASAICRLLDDSSLRDRLRQAGKERVQNFTWHETAWGVWQIVKEAKSQGG